MENILSSIANNTVVCNAAKSGCKATTGNGLPVLQNRRFCNRAYCKQSNYNTFKKKNQLPASIFYKSYSFEM